MDFDPTAENRCEVKGHLWEYTGLVLMRRRTQSVKNPDTAYSLRKIVMIHGADVEVCARPGCGLIRVARNEPAGGL